MTAGRSLQCGSPAITAADRHYGTRDELARGAGVHEATVSRLARKPGFDGCPVFRQALQAEFIPGHDTAARMKRTIDASAKAEVLALTMAKRFSRYGCDVQVRTGNVRSLAEGVLGMTGDDILLADAFRRTPRAWPALAERARQVGTTTIPIPGMAGRVIVPPPDQWLAAPRGGNADRFQTLTIPMAISSAIGIAAGTTRDRSVMQRSTTSER